MEEYKKPVQVEQHSNWKSQLVTGSTSHQISFNSSTSPIKKPKMTESLLFSTCVVSQCSEAALRTSQLVVATTLPAATDNRITPTTIYQPCTTRADNYCILVWAHGEKKIIHTDTNKQINDN